MPTRFFASRRAWRSACCDVGGSTAPGVAYAYIRERQKEGEIVTGLLYLSPDSSDLHEQSNTVAAPLAELAFEDLCPGRAELEKLQARFR